MSSPIGRSSDPNAISPYAPKWARDPNAAPSLRSRLRMADKYVPDLPADDRSRHHIADKYFPDLPADDSGYVAERGLHFNSLEPSVVPEPPIPEVWRRDRERPLIRSNSVMRMLLLSLFVVLLAALTSFVVVVILPGGHRFALLQKATKESVGTPDGNVPMAAARSVATADKNMPAPAVYNRQSPPAHAHPAPAPPERSAATQLEAMRPVSAAPTAGKLPVSSEPGPASSILGRPTPAATAPAQAAAVDSAPKTKAVPVTKVKTVPIRPNESTRPLNPDEIETLLKQGANFISVGDFASARIVFRRVAEAHNARGAYALAATYDPIALGKIGGNGSTPDIAKARQWYAKASELGSRDAGSRLAALDKEVGISVASVNSDISVSEDTIATTGRQPRDEATSENATSSGTSGATVSYWKNRMSIMRLDATGVSRKFIFFKPSPDQMKAGAKVGSLLFDGQISGKDYVGSAFSYSEKCGREQFPVSGQIKNNASRVILTGMSPLMDRNCRRIGKIKKALVLDFIGPGAK